MILKIDDIMIGFEQRKENVIFIKRDMFHSNFYVPDLYLLTTFTLETGEPIAIVESGFYQN